MVYLSQVFAALAQSSKEVLSKLNWVDIVVLTIFARTSYIGIRKGLFIEIVKSAGLLLALVISVTEHSIIGNEISQRLNLEVTLSLILASGGIFLGVYVAVRLVGIVLQKILKAEAQGFWNHFWGGWVGLTRGIVVVTCLLTSSLLIGSGYLTESIEAKSLLAPQLVKGGAAAYKTLHRFSTSFTIEGFDQNVSKTSEASD